MVVVTGPKCYFVRRCPWTGYYYAKGSRGNKSKGLWQRAIRGMKWNHYMRRGLKPLKNHASELMFLVNLSVSWGLIKRSRALGRSIPGMPLQEGIMGEKIRIRLPASLSGRSERHRSDGRERVKPDIIETSGRDRTIDSAERAETPSTPRRRLEDDDEDEVLDVMRLPGVTVIKESPESYVKLVRPVQTKLLINKKKPKRRRKPSAKKAVVRVQGSAPRRVKTKKPPRIRSRDKTTVIRNPKARKKRPKEAPRIIRRGVVAARKQEKPVVVRIARSPEPKAREIEAPKWVYNREHRPTVSSVQKKVIQLKVARADDPNLPDS